MTAPAANAPKSKWAAYAEDEYGLDVDGMTRADIIAAVEDAVEDADNQADTDLGLDNVDEDAVPEHLRFTSEVADDQEDVAGPLDIEIDGIRATLNPPSETALAIRYAEYSAAETVMDQALAILGLISTSMDRSSYLMLRQRLLAPRQEGKKFSDELLANLLSLILDRWGGGSEVPSKPQAKNNLRKIGGNRAQRRARR